jgi:hypothetical protein
MVFRTSTLTGEGVDAVVWHLMNEIEQDTPTIKLAAGFSRICTRIGSGLKVSNGL